MPLTQVLESPVSEFACCDLDRPVTTTSGLRAHHRIGSQGLVRIVIPSPPGAVRPSVLRCIISA